MPFIPNKCRLDYEHCDLSFVPLQTFLVGCKGLIEILMCISIFVQVFTALTGATATTWSRAAEVQRDLH